MVKNGTHSTLRRGSCIAALFLSLVLVLMLSAGCSRTTSATTAAPAPAPVTSAAPVPAAIASEVIKLKMSSPYFEVTAPSKYAAHFCDLVEQKTSGKVKIERFYGATLGTLQEHLQLVTSGSVDIISMHVGTNGQVLPLNDANPPNEALTRDETQTLVNNFRSNPDVKAIMEAEQTKNNIKIFNYNTAGVSGVVSKSPISALAELKGKKLNVIGSSGVSSWNAMGWIPANVQLTDVYDGLSKGVIDAGYGALSATLSMKWFDVSKSYLNLNVWTCDIPIAVNLKKFQSLPADVQQAFIEAGQETSAWSVEFDVQTTNVAFGIFDKADCKVIAVPYTDTKLFADTFAQYRNAEWLDRCGKAGVTDKAQVLDKIWKDMYAAAAAKTAANK